MGTPILSKEEIFRLPQGITGFPQMKLRHKIYVDKTALVYDIAGGDAPCFLSRPKRFGKSLLVSTLESLFSQGLKDFEGLAIEKLWHEDRTYKVLHLDFSQYADLNAEKLSAMLSQRIADLMVGTAVVDPLDAKGDFMTPGLVLERACDKVSVSSLVLLVDEYDAPITHHLDDPVMREAVVDVINGFFAAVKKCQICFRFIFVTGITRIAHVSLFSVFNNLKELTLSGDFASLVGFTEEELHRYFHPYVENAAAVLDMTVEDVYSRLKTRYDGYRFTLDADAPTLYNPWSVLSFLSAPKDGFDNYWYLSGGGTPTLLLENLKAHHVSLDYASMKHEPPTVDKESLKLKSEAQNIPTELLLWQTGYYTLEPLNPELAHLVMPNEEVEDSLTRLIEDMNHLGLSTQTKNRLHNLPALIDAVDLESVQELFNDVLNECLTPDTKVFNYEPDIRNILYMKIPEQKLTKLREHQTLHGESDLELKTHKTHLVIEFKRTYEDRGVEASLQEGIRQIKTKEYGKGSCALALVRAVMVCDSKERKIVLTKRVD